MTHTPGPWIADKSHADEWEGITIWASDVVIAHVVADQHGQHEHNARLIVKAPTAIKLAETLRGLIDAIYREHPEKIPFFCRTEVEQANDTLAEWDAKP